jgi:hypothetical protein
MDLPLFLKYDSSSTPCRDASCVGKIYYLHFILLYLYSYKKICVLTVVRVGVNEQNNELLTSFIWM